MSAEHVLRAQSAHIVKSLTRGHVDWQARTRASELDGNQQRKTQNKQVRYAGVEAEGVGK